MHQLCFVCVVLPLTRLNLLKTKPKALWNWRSLSVLASSATIHLRFMTTTCVVSPTPAVIMSLVFPWRDKGTSMCPVFCCVLVKNMYLNIFKCYLKGYKNIMGYLHSLCRYRLCIVRGILCVSLLVYSTTCGGSSLLGAGTLITLGHRKA
jgi:hypothetical protein